MGNTLSRIQQFAEVERTTIGTIERTIGASKGVLSRAINNGTDIQSKWLTTMVEKYPHLSGAWLLSGEGNMLKGEGEALPVAQPARQPGEGIPLIPIEAMAGALTSEQSVLDYECERYVVPAFRGADFLIRINGMSMSPNFRSGDIVACKRVSLSRLFFQWNKVYVADTAQGALIKRIKPGHDERHLLFVSDNADFDPFELPLEEINALGLVIGTIRLE